jgi:hypothetical protein
LTPHSVFTNHTRRLGQLFWIPAFVFAAHAQTAAIKCIPSGVNVDCRVDNPVVTQHSFDYKTVTFKPGDKVTINAGGCVQTGGSGKTWKRYVNPSGSNSDRLYHGLIGIPGVTAAGTPLRIQAYVGKTVVIPPGITAANNFLVLGYEDDNYSDNGYWGHDDGTEDQCKNVGNAFVTLHIDRTTKAPPPPTAAPFDLEWPTGVDVNGIPMNPQWHAEANVATHPDPAKLCNSFPFSNNVVSFGVPPCTTQAPGIDNPSGVNSYLCESFGATPGKLDGHVNWMAATYTGHITWSGHKDWTQIGDDDYNIDLQPSNGKGLTAPSPDHMELEFDSDETIDHFSTAWWQQFHQAVDNNSGNSGGAPGAMVDGHSAIITGLMNLDAEHDAHSELHPVWAIAIRLNKDSEFNANDDAWAFFARNWGNEGFCSQNQHYIDLDSLSFSLPGPTNSSVSLISSDFKANRGDVASSFTAEPGTALMSFQLGQPENGGMIEGTIHLKWTGGLTSAAPTLFTSRFGPVRALAAEIVKNRSPEERGAALLAQVPAAKRPALDAALRKPAPQKLTVTVTPKLLPTPQALLTARLGRPTVRSAPDPNKAAKDKKRAQALCAAFNNSVPGAPANYCISVR